MNGETSGIQVANPGTDVRGAIQWTNNLPSRITDARIEIRITGSILDRFSVKAEQGFYNSVNNTIILDKSTVPELELLNPGDSGHSNFSFASLVPSAAMISSFKNQEITLEVSVKGKRSDGANVPEELLSNVTRKVRLGSNLSLVAQTLYRTGPFTNNGALPPKAEKATTYTIALTVSNAQNDARDVKVTASLPTYVTWLGNTNPTTEKISIDQNKKITWDVGEVKSGTGYTSTARKVYFQVTFVPSTSQIGQSPSILGDITIEGVDRFTNTALGSSRTGLTTVLNNDTGTKPGDELVTQ